MTVNSTDNRLSYAGNGTIDAFATQYFLADEDLTVILVTDATGAEQEKTLDSDYTVTGAEVPGGGTVTFTTPPAAAETVVICVDPEFTQAELHVLEAIERRSDTRARVLPEPGGLLVVEPRVGIGFPCLAQAVAPDMKARGRRRPVDRRLCR